jgi:ATPase subunit of ABC transporter with duplicated ATPase domains
MPVLTLVDAHLAFGHVALLDGASLALDAGERVGLIGRNGTGKSSLLKVVAGIEHLDDGLLQTVQGARIRYVAQEPEFDLAGTVFDAVGEGVAEARVVRDGYETLAAQSDLDPAKKAAELDALQARALGRNEKARRARARARRRPRRAPPRRADQPPRPRRDRVARGAAGRLSRQHRRRHARPRVPRRRRDADRRARPWCPA